MITTLGVGDDEAEQRETLIRDILKRGKVARFTNTITGGTKDVCEWNIDADGDLTAYRTSPGAKTTFVCWTSVEYRVEEIDAPTPT